MKRSYIAAVFVCGSAQIAFAQPQCPCPAGYIQVDDARGCRCITPPNMQIFRIDSNINIKFPEIDPDKLQNVLAKLSQPTVISVVPSDKNPDVELKNLPDSQAIDLLQKLGKVDVILPEKK